MPRKTSIGVDFSRAIEMVLTPLADETGAAEMCAYLRGRFQYFGIPTPRRRAAVKPLIRSFAPVNPVTLRAAASALWQMPQRECQYVAADLLSGHCAALTIDDLPWLLELAQKKSWWDSVDALVKVVGKIVRVAGAKGRREMDRAVRAENFWVRRIAMLHQLGWRGDTDVARLFRYADLLAPEKEFFVRKAIGWALRDYAWHDWRAVDSYLKTARERLSPLTCREAMKNFPRPAGRTRVTLQPRSV
ncbi:MAG TPA: DNA alkylation repair protein [Terracidiphilus sp.]|nr:DNA alkylation repair protein [Terracidiphilus sp.]